MQTFHRITVLKPMQGVAHKYFSIEIGGTKTIVWKSHQPKLFFAIEEGIGGRELTYPAELNIAVTGLIVTINTEEYHLINNK